MQFEVFCYISMWNIKSLWSFFLAFFVISGIVSSSLWSESDSILAKQLIKVPYKMSLTFVKTTWRPESPWYSDIFRIPLALSPGGWPPRVTWVCKVCHAAWSWSWADSDLCGGMLTGSEVPDQKSVIRFRLTMSLSALPRSSLEEESQGPRPLETAGRVTWMGALTTSEPGTRGSLVSTHISTLWSLALV